MIVILYEHDQNANMLALAQSYMCCLHAKANALKYDECAMHVRAFGLMTTFLSVGIFFEKFLSIMNRILSALSINSLYILLGCYCQKVILLLLLQFILISLSRMCHIWINLPLLYMHAYANLILQVGRCLHPS